MIKCQGKWRVYILSRGEFKGDSRVGERGVEVEGRVDSALHYLMLMTLSDVHGVATHSREDV